MFLSFGEAIWALAQLGNRGGGAGGAGGAMAPPLFCRF